MGTTMTTMTRSSLLPMRLVLAWIAIVVALASDVRGQGLGDAAAKENERRARIDKSSKTFTESDLQEAGHKRAREGSPSSAPSPPSQTAAAKPATPSPDPSASPDADTSAGDKRARAAELRARMARALASLERAEKDLALAEDNWRMVSDNPFVVNRARWVDVETSLAKARALLDRAKSRVEALRQERDDIDDAARREGIPQRDYLP
jgi:hypothetical protein